MIQLETTCFIRATSQYVSHLISALKCSRVHRTLISNSVYRKLMCCGVDFNKLMHLLAWRSCIAVFSISCCHTVAWKQLTCYCVHRIYCVTSLLTRGCCVTGLTGSWSLNSVDWKMMSEVAGQTSLEVHRAVVFRDSGVWYTLLGFYSGGYHSFTAVCWIIYANLLKGWGDCRYEATMYSFSSTKRSGYCMCSHWWY